MISMDGKGRCMDNIFVERLWRSLKYEEVYLHAYASVAEAKTGIGAWLDFYNTERQHQSLGYRTPQQIYQEGLWICGRSAVPTGCASPLPERARKAGKCSPSPTYPQAPQSTKRLIQPLLRQPEYCASVEPVYGGRSRRAQCHGHGSGADHRLYR
jgi:putative transposase